MSFFDFSPGGDGQAEEWKVSSKIWIYWTISIPLTALTLLAWLVWMRAMNHRSKVGELWGGRASNLRKRLREKV
jgi:hypothetical protein